MVLVGVCWATGACGPKFSAGGPSAGVATSAGASGSQGGAEAPMAGSESGGAADEVAGRNSSGGLAGVGASPSTSGSAGIGGKVGAGGMSGGTASAGTGGTGGRAGAGGSSGASGAGGSAQTPPIPALGLALWLRADRGLVLKDGLVQQWVDQSSAQQDALQTAVNQRPQYLATGFNGLPTIDFDGQDDFLKFASGFGTFSEGLAAFIVAKPRDSRCASMLEFSNGSEVQDIAFGMWQDRWTYEVAENYVQRGVVDLTHFTLYAAVHHQGELADLRANGNAVGSLEFALPDLMVRQNNFLGRSLYVDCGPFQGQISEVILYAREVTDKELLVIEGYLQNHWGLPVTAAP